MMRTSFPRFPESHATINKLVVLLLCLIAAIILGLVMGIFHLYSNLGKDYGYGEARLRDAGLPVKLDELDAWYEAVPEGENAAALLVPIFREMKDTVPDNPTYERLTAPLNERPPDSALKPEYFSDLCQILDEFDEAYLSRLEEALSRKRCRFRWTCERDILPIIPTPPPLEVPAACCVCAFVSCAWKATIPEH